MKLISDEGVEYRPFIRSEGLKNDLTRLEVGIKVKLVDGTQHTLLFVPSISTDEGPGTGNVFIYEDDDPFSHLAWEVDDPRNGVDDEEN